MAEAGNIVVRISAKTDEFNRAMADVSNKLSNTGKTMTDVGKKMTAGITVPLAAVGTAAIKMSTDFNAAMANVATLIPGNVDRVNELKGAVQDMAVEVGKSTGDLADGLYQVISAFGDTSDTVKILEINAKAAAAGVATTTDAINLTSAVTKGYGDTSAEAVQKVSDLAFTTVRLGQTTFPELASSIGRVTPLAASLGVEMEELFGVMATATGVTGTAAEVSTQLRGVLQALMAPTGDMTRLIQELGYESGQAMLQQMGLQGTIEAIVRASEESGVPLQKFIGSIEGQTLALALAGPQADSFTEKLKEMQDVTGATDEAFREQTEGVNAAGFSMAQLKAQVEVAAQEIGDKLAPALSRVVDLISNMVSWFTSLSPSVQTAIIMIGMLAAAIGPLLMIVGKLMQSWGMLVALIPKLGVAFTALTGPIGIVIAAIAGAIAVGVALYKNWDEIKEGITTIWNAIKDVATTVWNAISDFLTGIWEGIKTVALTIWEGIKVVIITPIEVLKGLLTTAWNFIKENVSMVWEGIRTTAATIWNNIKTTIMAPVDTLKVLIPNAWDMIATATSNTWNGIKETTAKIWDSMVDVVKASINTIIGLINGMINALNKVKIPIPEIPEWVPGIGGLGGGSIGFDIPNISYLAQGGFIKAGNPTPAIIGEGRYNEVVMPLSSSVLSELAGEIVNKMDYGRGNGIYQEIHIHSPEPLTPSETARQIKNVSRQLALEL